jgi:hypothetical protein
MDTHQSADCLRVTEFTVNGRALRFDEPVIDVRDALNAAQLTPASEYQAVLVESGRTHLLETEDKIVLADHPHGDLRTFLSDRSFSFTINEISQVWGTDQMETDELYAIWPPADGYDWVLEKVDEPDVVLRPGSTVAFGPKGVEHIVARPHHNADKLLVTVLTLSGVFPAEGALRVSNTDLISSVLEKAAKRLELKDTTGWVVSAAGNDVSPSLTFAQAGLAGVVELDWMPREGGGGNA